MNEYRLVIKRERNGKPVFSWSARMFGYADGPEADDAALRHLHQRLGEFLNGGPRQVPDEDAA